MRFALNSWVLIIINHHYHLIYGDTVVTASHQYASNRDFTAVVDIIYTNYYSGIPTDYD